MSVEGMPLDKYMQFERILKTVGKLFGFDMIHIQMTDGLPSIQFFKKGEK